MVEDARRSGEAEPGYWLRVTPEYQRLRELAVKTKFCYEEEYWWREDFTKLEEAGYDIRQVNRMLKNELGATYFGGKPKPRNESGAMWF